MMKRTKRLIIKLNRRSKETISAPYEDKYIIFYQKQFYNASKLNMYKVILDTLLIAFLFIYAVPTRIYGVQTHPDHCVIKKFCCSNY